MAQGDPVADLDIVRHLDVRQQQVVVADPGRVIRAVLDRDPFADHVAVADEHAGRVRAREFFADDDERTDAVELAERGRSWKKNVSQ